MGKLSTMEQDHHEFALLPARPSKQKQRTKKTIKKKEPLKITYISSPTLVKATNASEFRALVQELTGKNSRVGEDDQDEYTQNYYSPVIPSPPTDASPDTSVEDHGVPSSYTSSLDEFDYSYLEVSAPEDGYLSNGGSNAIAATAGDAPSYSAAEMEEGGFSLWREVPDAFGNGGGLQFSLNCVYV